MRNIWRKNEEKIYLVTMKFVCIVVFFFGGLIPRPLKFIYRRFGTLSVPSS